MDRIAITTHDGQTRDIEPHAADSLAQAIFLAGYWRDVPLCAGLGKCGLCRVRFAEEAPAPRAEERRRLGDAALEEGWRLSCLHPAVPARIELPRPRRIRPERGTSEISTTAARGKPEAGEVLLAVDLGTTSLHWAARRDGRTVAHGRELNPQIGLGSEIMSRLSRAAGEDGRDLLRNLVLVRLREIVREVEAEAGPVAGLTVAGNSAMVYLLLGLDVSGLSRSPYHLTYFGGETHELPGLPPMRVPRLFSPFVGADLAAGLAWLYRAGQTPRHPFLLADLGTNGEFILALSETRHLCASVPMGPALEGVGLSFGRTAGPGAVTNYTLAPDGLRPERLPGGEDESPGISGTGYLSLTALLRRNGLLDRTGRFGQGTTPLGERLHARLREQGGELVFDLLDGMYLRASDVEELLKVKAACNLALTRLLRASSLAPSRLESLQLAGSFGEHVRIEDIAELGFLPPTLALRTVKAGNTSLLGAGLLAESAEARGRSAALPEPEIVDLAGDADFTRDYLERMVFEYVG